MSVSDRQRLIVLRIPAQLRFQRKQKVVKQQAIKTPLSETKRKIKKCYIINRRSPVNRMSCESERVMSDEYSIEHKFIWLRNFFHLYWSYWIEKIFWQKRSIQCNRKMDCKASVETPTLQISFSMKNSNQIIFQAKLFWAFSQANYLPSSAIVHDFQFVIGFHH